MSGRTFICSYCSSTTGQFTAPSEAFLLSHVRLVHSLDPNFTIQCTRDDCSRTFRNFRTYQNHILTHQPSESCHGDFEDDTLSLPSVDNDENFDEVSPYLPTAEDMQSFAARWILKTSETRSLTRAATIGIVQDVADMVTCVVQCLLSQAQNLLGESGIDSSRLEDIFSSHVTQPFRGLTSFRNQLQYYRKHFELIVSSM